ncbi:hypothetical protein DAPPUDRAFT_309494 [Daphnia pulex]|uniref:Uncharacterized protein n=1 Tax=Daphnia pulex TaxID=6669 RepID=E9FRM9_DAPPU|nr:hypothetical protein DAPPUDRAFT_309494 [Daphnia pulex]|eukprot:EFX89879.1 hypothetical protein DAPPUDRAFT_309494 [Daphnia pulex]
MATFLGNWLLWLLLATSLTPAESSTIGATDPALNSKPVLGKFVEHLKNRKRHPLQQSDASYSHYIRYPVTQPSPTLLSLSSNIAFPSGQPLFHPHSYSNSNLDKFTSSSQMSKFTEKYSSKLKNLMSYLKPEGNAAVAASRYIPNKREIVDIIATDNSLFGPELSNLISSNILVFGPVVVTFFVGVFILRKFGIPFPGIATSRRRRMDRNLDVAEDLNEVFGFDNFVTAEQSRNLALLAARLDSVLETYPKNVYMKDTCLEKYPCQAGRMKPAGLASLPSPFPLFKKFKNR